jgi:hypothetical protein
MFDPCPVTEAGYEDARSRLREELSRWSELNGTRSGPDSFEELVHYKWGYLDRHLTRWSRGHLDTIYLELYPAKMIVGDDELDEVLQDAAAFITFLDETGLLDPASESAPLLHAHLAKLDAPFRRNMADPSRYSPGKRFWLAAMVEGVDLDDQDAVSAFMQRFNANPFPEREKVLGRRPATPWTGTGRFTPPGTRPALGKNARRGRCR